MSCATNWWRAMSSTSAPDPMDPCPWLTAPKAAAALGVSISTLYRWRTQQLLVPGEDWYRKFPSARSPLLYNVEKVQRRIAALSARSAQELESVVG